MLASRREWRLRNSRNLLRTMFVFSTIAVSDWSAPSSPSAAARYRPSYCQRHGTSPHRHGTNLPLPPGTGRHTANDTGRHHTHTAPICPCRQVQAVILPTTRGRHHTHTHGTNLPLPPGTGPSYCQRHGTSPHTHGTSLPLPPGTGRHTANDTGRHHTHTHTRYQSAPAARYRPSYCQPHGDVTTHTRHQSAPAARYRPSYCQRHGTSPHTHGTNLPLPPGTGRHTANDTGRHHTHTVPISPCRPRYRPSYCQRHGTSPHTHGTNLPLPPGTGRHTANDTGRHHTHTAPICPCRQVQAVILPTTRDVTTHTRYQSAPAARYRPSYCQRHGTSPHTHGTNLPLPPGTGRHTANHTGRHHTHTAPICPCRQVQAVILPTTRDVTTHTRYQSAPAARYRPSYCQRHGTSPHTHTHGTNLPLPPGTDRHTANDTGRHHTHTAPICPCRQVQAVILPTTRDVTTHTRHQSAPAARYRPSYCQPHGTSPHTHGTNLPLPPGTGRHTANDTGRHHTHTVPICPCRQVQAVILPTTRDVTTHTRHQSAPAARYRPSYCQPHGMSPHRHGTNLPLPPGTDRHTANDTGRHHTHTVPICPCRQVQAVILPTIRDVTTHTRHQSAPAARYRPSYCQRTRDVTTHTRHQSAPAARYRAVVLPTARDVTTHTRYQSAPCCQVQTVILPTTRDVTTHTVPICPCRQVQGRHTANDTGRHHTHTAPICPCCQVQAVILPTTRDVTTHTRYQSAPAARYRPSYCQRTRDVTTHTRYQSASAARYRPSYCQRHGTSPHTHSTNPAPAARYRPSYCQRHGTSPHTHGTNLPLLSGTGRHTANDTGRHHTHMVPICPCRQVQAVILPTTPGRHHTHGTNLPLPPGTGRHTANDTERHHTDTAPICPCCQVQTVILPTTRDVTTHTHGTNLPLPPGTGRHTANDTGRHHTHTVPICPCRQVQAVILPTTRDVTTHTRHQSAPAARYRPSYCQRHGMSPHRHGTNLPLPPGTGRHTANDTGRHHTHTAPICPCRQVQAVILPTTRDVTTHHTGHQSAPAARYRPSYCQRHRTSPHTHGTNLPLPPGTGRRTANGTGRHQSASTKRHQSPRVVRPDATERYEGQLKYLVTSPPRRLGICINTCKKTATLNSWPFKSDRKLHKMKLKSSC